MRYDTDGGDFDQLCLVCRVYINSSMFHKSHQTSLKARSTDDTVVHPLPTLFHLLGLTPFKKVILSFWFCMLYGVVEVF